jgi:Protein of unknown function (DUF3298)
MNRIGRQTIPLLAVAGAAVIIGGTACGTSSTRQNAPDPAGAATTSAAVTAVATTRQPQPVPSQGSACDELGGTVDAKGICGVHTSGAGYEITFTFPTDYPDQQALTDYMTQRRDAFVGYTDERPPQDRPYELDATATAYRSGAPGAGTESLVFAEYSDSGGAHPVNGYRAFTYDLDKGAAITFDTLFAPGTDPVAVLDPIVRRQWEKFSQDYGPLGDNTLGARLYQNFALTDDAVIFFIGQGQWLPEVAGPRKVSVPRTQLASLLA